MVYYMLIANNVTAAQDEDVKLIQERLASTFQMRGTYEAYEALRKGAKLLIRDISSTNRIHSIYRKKDMLRCVLFLYDTLCHCVASPLVKL